MLGGGATAGAGQRYASGKKVWVQNLNSFCILIGTPPVPIESNEYLKSQARAKVKKMEELDKILESSLPDFLC